MNNTTDDQADDDEDVQNDAVIASAFRASLLVIMLLCLPLIGILVYVNFNKDEEVSTEVESTPPDERPANEKKIPSLVMTSMAGSCGIEFTHESGREGQKLLPETMGSGAAVFDYNGDGHLDVLLVNSSRWPWDNRGEQDSSSRLYAGDGACLLYTSPSPRDS